MTKHDFHIALVLLALITAGTLGYQSLNAETGSTSNNCTLALYFSSFDGCNSSDTFDILPPPFLNERMHSTHRPNETGFIYNIQYDTLHRRTEWSDGIHEGILKIEPDMIQQVDSISNMVSDAHREIIKQVKMYQ